MAETKDSGGYSRLSPSERRWLVVDLVVVGGVIYWLWQVIAQGGMGRG